MTYLTQTLKLFYLLKRALKLFLRLDFKPAPSWLYQHEKHLLISLRNRLSEYDNL